MHLHLGYLAAIEGGEDAETELRVAEQLLASAEGSSAIEPLSTLAYSYGRLGLRQDARRAAERFIAGAKQSRVPPLYWAAAYLGIGDVDEAYQWAAIAADGPLRPFVSLELEFVLNAHNDPLLEEPRFRELRRKLGAAEFL